ncbi:integrase [Burkholderia cepacia]|uniref:tyrosine-type recombinase/integrase n=1 Tax=Burkholderia cepacia TaxID=292 RepID=UPI0007602F77|nr:integrase arm-type DNA-binding domain-containing protein [Burkholderia cepacia]KVZ27010.1 integrase [Burkholderia cepacia]
MATRQLHQLNALKISKEVTPGYHADGGGLYLQISSSGSRSWIFRYMIGGRRREMGLGPLSMMSLAAARKEAASCRELVSQKIDPIEARKRLHHARAVESAPGVTFRQAAEAFIADRDSTWKNRKHAQQWRNTMETYAYPEIGDVDVRDVSTEMIVRILAPIWVKKAETARRVRGRIKAILDAETVLGRRSGDNPARFVDHLDRVLPRSKRRQQVEHHPALPWKEIPGFMKQLDTHPRRAARMLHLLILTAVRTNEVRFARLEEFDLDARVWTIPGERMKCDEPLRVPLSDRAVEVVRAAMAKAKWGYLFPGFKEGRPLSNMAMLTLLGRMGRDEITVHGFRSTFQDWAEEYGEYDSVMVDKALAHATPNQTRRAYQRGDMLERRREMMEHWARYCDGQTATVVPFTRPAAQTAA